MNKANATTALATLTSHTKNTIDRFWKRPALLEQRIAELEASERLSKTNEAKARAINTKAKVYVLTSTKELIPYDEFRKFEIMKADAGSTQVAEDSKFVVDSDLAAKPYDPATFLVLYESNPVFHRTVDQIARDAAGLGWRLEPREQDKENKEERKRIEAFLNHPNPHKPLRKILEGLIIDWGIFGYYALEINRSNDNKVAEIYHTPSHTVWVWKGKKTGNGRWSDARQKYCQKRGSNKVWFKRFGEEKNFSAETGEEGEFTGVKKANEMLFVTGYYPGNDYYSVPAILPAVGSVIGLIEIRDYNLSFFTNHGIPEYIVLLTGDWEPGSDATIANYLRSTVKGGENAHKTMVMELPEGCSIELKPVAVKEKEGSFRIYNQIWREDALLAYSMPPYRVGILPTSGRLSGGGGKEAQELTEIYKRGVIEPLQDDLEDLFNFFLIEQGLGCSSYWWRLNDMDVRDWDKEVERYNSLVAHGAITPNQERELLDLGGPYPEGNRHYISSNLKPIQMEKGRKKK